MEDDDTDTQPSSSELNDKLAEDDGACNLSMIMEQSYMDADLNLCQSGMYN